MDLQAGLLCIAFAVISALVIYGILVSTMKEKSYDEAMADLRKKTEEQFPQTRTTKEKSKDKKLKKAGKKVKEKATSDQQAAENASESERGKTHVVFAEEPEVAVVSDDAVREDENRSADDEESVAPAKEQPVQKQNAAKSKSAPKHEQHNKAEKQSQPQQQQQPQQKNGASAAEKSNSSAKAEKNASQEKKELVAKSANSKQQQQQQQALVQQQVQQQHSQPQPQGSRSSSVASAPPAQMEKLTASPSLKSNKKKKSDLATLHQMSGGSDGINVNLLIPIVRKAELSRSEVQLLVEILLNKHLDSTDGSSEWIEGRQDPVVKLKKQLADKERALAEEQEASTGLQSRLKELRTELNAEKHTVRSLEEAMQGRQAEVSSFAAKLQHAAEEKQALAQQIQQLQGKLGEERLVVRKIQEEAGQTQGALQQEVIAQRQQLDLHIARFNDQQHQQQETISALEAQLGNQLQEHEALTDELTILRERTTHLQDSAAQAQDLIRQIEEMRGVQANLEHMLGAAQYENGSLQTEVSELSEQLSILRTENDKLDGVVQGIQADNARLREANERLNVQVSSACVEARQLRDENETLAAQVTASMERPATEGRENGDTNSYSEKHSHIEDQDSIQKKDLLLEEVNGQLKAKELMVESLTSEVNSYKTEVLEQQRLLQGLREEVTKHKLEADRLASEILQQSSEVSRLTDQLQAQQTKNNELRTKNWKVMDALSTTENLLQNKVKESQRIVNEAVEKALSEQQSSTRKLLLRIFPEINVPESKDQSVWFERFESALKAWKPQESEDQSTSVVELEKQNAQLQAMVAHYKKIIAETEGMLNRLQSHVEQAEGKWGQDLQALKSQLEVVTRERDALQASSGASHEKPTNGYCLVDDGCAKE